MTLSVSFFPPCFSLLQLVCLKAQTPFLLYLRLTPPYLVCVEDRTAKSHALEDFYIHTDKCRQAGAPLQPKSLDTLPFSCPLLTRSLWFVPKWPSACTIGGRGLCRVTAFTLSVPFCISLTPFIPCHNTTFQFIVFSLPLNDWSSSIDFPLSLLIFLFHNFYILLSRPIPTDASGHISNFNIFTQWRWIMSYSLSPFTKRSISLQRLSDFNTTHGLSLLHRVVQGNTLLLLRQSQLHGFSKGTWVGVTRCIVK